MKLGSFDSLVRAFEEAGVRYLVAGGLAVNAHGYLRFTKDIDLVLKLAPENVASAFAALEGIGYRPRAHFPDGLCGCREACGLDAGKGNDGPELLV